MAAGMAEGSSGAGKLGRQALRPREPAAGAWRQQLAGPGDRSVGLPRAGPAGLETDA